MNSIRFNVNAKAVAVFSNKLDKLRKSALPNAVRNTLNSAAFDVKQKTMPATSQKSFVHRKDNFFKANSKVFMAQGYNTNSMKSVVGFIPHGAKYNNKAVRELEQQEFSGTIPDRDLVPMTPSRSGKSHSGEVLPSNRLKAIKNIIYASKSKGRNKKEEFIKAAIYAGKGGFVIGNLGGVQNLFRINSIKRVKGKTVINKSAPLYSFKQNRSVKVKKATHFMRTASFITQKKLNGFFVREATRQIQRTFK